MMYLKALEVAATIHKDQVRKGSNIPYLTHLMTVSSYVFEFGGDEAQAIAGLLHDALEDQADKISASEIEKMFGHRVAEIVLSCTDSEEDPKPPWKERKSAYLNNLKDKSPYIKLVVACDKLHNAQCINRDVTLYGESIWKRFSAPKEEIFWYYSGLLENLRKNFDSNVLKLLEHEVEIMKQIIQGKS